MKEKWYREIIEPVLEVKTNILFLIDPANLIQCTKIKECLSETFNKVIHYESEIKLRRLIRENNKFLIVFSDSKSIPFDLLSIYATIELDLDNLFPLLNKRILLQYSFADYQEIYAVYLNFKKNKYERLSEIETKEFIDSILSSGKIKTNGRISDLIDSLKNTLKNELTTEANTWGIISKLFGELNYLIDENELNVNIKDLRIEINSKFKEYVLKYYNNLIYTDNSFIHSNIMNIIFSTSKGNNAVIFFDCMGFEEWNSVKEYLKGKFKFEYITKYSFSMLPSETSYSGNALFSGLTPKRIKNLNIVSNIHWKNEERLFKYCLSKIMGIDENLVYFKRCIDLKNLEIDLNSLNDYNAIGIAISFIDHFAHSDLMDKRRLMKNIKLYLKRSNLDVLIDSLIRSGFHLYFVSDHGNIFCKGNGINVKKDLVDTRAKRYLISDKKELLEEYRTNDSELIQFKNIIGDDYLLLLSGDNMFAGKSEEGLTHGGISIEEMIVPFIEVK